MASYCRHAEEGTQSHRRVECGTVNGPVRYGTISTGDQRTNCGGPGGRRLARVGVTTVRPAGIGRRRTRTEDPG
ncbi:hypothetical protein FMEAI12_3940025 [Parafrankia sp. Ea1.12]|nr:hypothetical protein FMEAI12_3940025 [Parafrankia sp. Ea1.12]